MPSSGLFRYVHVHAHTYTQTQTHTIKDWEPQFPNAFFHFNPLSVFLTKALFLGLSGP